MTCKLSLANLAEIARTAAVPAYRRDQLKAGILHFGVGNFHRAHQAIYLHELFNQGKDLDWAILGAGVRAVRPKHWGARFVVDRHRGYNASVLDGRGRRVVFGGDTAMTDAPADKAKQTKQV